MKHDIIFNNIHRLTLNSRRGMKPVFHRELTRMTKRLNAAEAIANVLGRDITDVKDNRYQYGRTSKPVFTAGEYYYCAGDVPAKFYEDESRWEWEKVEHPSNDKYGWTVWKAHMNK